MANETWIDGTADWTTAADWSTGTVPGAADDVTIAQGFPRVTTNVGTVASIDATAPAALTIDDGGALATTGALASTGSINLDNNAGSGVSTLNVGAAAGFGTAGILTGSVDLNSQSAGGVLLEFASGQITGIAADSSLSLNGANVFVADAGATNSNSALIGLASNAGTLTLDDGAVIATSGALSNSGSIDVSKASTLSIGGVAGFGTAAVLDGKVQVDTGGLLEFAGGQITSIAADGSLVIAGANSFVADAGATTSNSALTGLASNAGSLSLGDASVTTGALANSGQLQLSGTASLTTGPLTNAATGSILLTGSSAATPTTLVVNGAAGFGTTGVLDGTVDLEGDALVQFATGQITSIAADGTLILDGAGNIVADAGATGTSSALTGLASNAGTLTIASGATLAATGSLINSNTLNVTGTGAELTTGGLSNSGTVSINQGGTIATTGPLSNSGTIGLNTGFLDNQLASLDVGAPAGFGTAAVLDGRVTLNGDALIRFDSGQITSIASDGALTLGDATAYIADAGATTSNSALSGLASNAGSLTLGNGATLATTGPLTNAATGTISLGGLTSGPTTTLNIGSAAGFGTAGVLDGTVALTGNSLLEFASGQITSIAADGALSLGGPNAFVADAGATTSNSALALAGIAGSLSLSGGVGVTTAGALGNSGKISLSGSGTTATTLNVNSAAGFGTAGVLTGQVSLTGNSQLLFAGGGQITSLAAGSSLFLDGPGASLGDAGETTSNTALVGLTDNAGTISIADGASANFGIGSSSSASMASAQSFASDTPPTVYNTGEIEWAEGKDEFYTGEDTARPLNNFFSSIFFNPPGQIKENAALSVQAVSQDSPEPILSNSGTLALGNFQLQGSGGVMVNGTLANTGTISLTGTEVGFSGGTPNISVLDVTTAAGFGTASVLTGQVHLAGYALLEFASGQITSIAANSSLSIEGAHAFVADGNASSTADAMATTSDSALALTSNAGTLALSDGASMTVAAGTTLTSTGTITLDAAADPNSNHQGGSSLTIGGTLASSGTTTIGGDGTGGTIVNGAGTLAVTGGTTTINQGSTVSVATISIGDPATLELAGGTTSSAIGFTPNADGTLRIDAAVLPSTGGTFANQISGFAAGDTIDLAGLAYAGNPLPLYDGTTLSLTEGGVTDTLHVSAAGLPVFTAMSDGHGGTAVTIVCFATGTRIRMVGSGGIEDVAVEELRIGDTALTASGGLRSIVWLGSRTLDCTALSTPSEAWPVRVRAGAFGVGRRGVDLPERDLLLSPGHPVLVGLDSNEVLVPIMCLINGTTIERVSVETVTYWHVELDAHDILLAEGLPAESYLDWGDRDFFTEGSDHALQNPDFVVPGLTGRCRPVALEGPVVEHERRRLDAVFAMRLAAMSAWPSDEGLFLGL